MLGQSERARRAAAAACATVLLAVTSVVTATYASATTTVSGMIAANTTWDLAGSPYLVTGNLQVNPGVP